MISDETRPKVDKVREMLAAGINIQATGEVTNAVVAGMVKACLDHIDELEADLKVAIAIGRMAARPIPDVPQAARGISDIATERQRQVDAKGWTPEHDDEHADQEMALAALCYVYASVYRLDTGFVRRYWRWDWCWWKPSDKRRNLVKAGALIAAEIDRLDRTSPVSRPHPQSDNSNQEKDNG